MAHDAPTTPALIGEILIDRYRLDSEIGQGGMGVVYRAHDVKLHNRPCAVKVLTGLTGDPHAAERFSREARVIASLTSPNTVRVYDTGTLGDGRPFIAMELLAGASLDSVLKAEGALAPNRTLKIMEGILSALEEAHQAGIVHRDLKPANIFLVKDAAGREHPTVLDFGVAKDLGDSDSFDTGTGIVGTPSYMAPEQFTRKGLSPRTDLYAVGLILYEMLSGRPPFTPNDPVPDELLSMPSEFRLGWLQVNRRPRKLEGVSAPLWKIISSLLAKSPEARPASALATLSQLNALSEPVADQPQVLNSGTEWVGAVLPAPPRRPWLWILGLGGVLATVGGLVYALDGGSLREAPQRHHITGSGIGAPTPILAATPDASPSQPAGSPDAGAETTDADPPDAHIAEPAQPLVRGRRPRRGGQRRPTSRRRPTTVEPPRAIQPKKVGQPEKAAPIPDERPKKKGLFF